MAEGDNDSDATQVYLLGKTYLANNQGQFYIRNDPIVSMASGDRHTIIVTRTGRAFAFGDNNFGQLGLGHTNPVEKVSCIKSLKFGNDEKVIMAACGRESSLVATNRGALYAFGLNSSYQLGLDDEDNQATPKLIQRLQGLKFKQLAMGAEHACALTDDGMVYVWGSNDDGQCGQINKVKVVKEPRELRVDHPIASISCGYYHTALVTEDGQLLVCGSNETRQLGRTMPDKHSSPLPISLPGRVKAVACGHHHTVVLTENGEVYSCGSGDRGQLGLTHRVQSADNFELVPGLPKRATAVAAGEAHTAVIGPRHDLYIFGDGKHGKLGSTTHSNEFEACRVERFKPYHVLNIVCGGCQTIVLAKKKPADAKKSSGSEEDVGNMTLSVTQRPKSQARINRNKSMNERSTHVSDSIESTLRPVRPVGAGNHLRVEPDPGSDSERSTKELSESLKSATFNQTHTISNGRFRPTQGPTLPRTQQPRGADDDLKPLRTGALDRTVKLTPETKKRQESEGEKSSSKDDDDDEIDQRRKKPSPVPPRRDVRRQKASDSDEAPARSSPVKKSVPPRQRSSDDDDDDDNDRFKKPKDPPASNRPAKAPPAAATRRRSSDDDDDDDDDDEEENDRFRKPKDPPASSRQTKDAPATRTRRGSLPSSSNSSIPTTRDGNQTIGSRPVDGTRASFRTPASKPLAKPTEPPKKEPEPAAQPPAQPGFFSRLFGGKPATPPAAAPPATNTKTTTTTAAKAPDAQPATDKNSKTCSVM